MEPSYKFDLSSFTIRWIICLFLVFAAYNPSGYSYVHWIGDADGWWLVKIAAGALLIAGNSFVISYSLRALTVAGMFLTSVFYGVVGYGLFSYEVIATEHSHIVMVVLVVWATILATGVSYPHASYRFTGVKHVNNI
jgi:hypothetical protein